MTDKAATTVAAADPGADAKDLLAGVEGVRQFLRRVGAALGAAATAVMAGLGYTQLHEIFPLPPGQRWLWASAAGAAALAAIGGAGWLAGRFFRAQRRVLISSNPDEYADLLSPDERRLKNAVFADQAHAEEAGGLLALDLRAARLDRISRRLAGNDRASVEEAANRTADAVRLALTQAVATIVEYRAERVFRGWTRIAFLTSVVGIISLFAIADYSKGQRDLIELRTKCAEGRAKGAANACDSIATRRERAALEASRKAKLNAARTTSNAKLEKARQIVPTTAKRVLQTTAACETLLADYPPLRAAGSDRARDVALLKCVEAAK